MFQALFHKWRQAEPVDKLFSLLAFAAIAAIVYRFGFFVPLLGV